MTVSKKQLRANRKNGKKGGVKTENGKSVVRYNALKHGLLAKEIVILVGDGAENPEEFHSLWESLVQQLKPKGTLEELLVEKIVCFFWRLRRAYRYEVGLIRNNLDTATHDFYSKTNMMGESIHKTDEEIDKEANDQMEIVEGWGRDKAHFISLQKKKASLEAIFEWEDNWDALFEEVSDELGELGIQNEPMNPDELYKSLKDVLKWSDHQIWEKLILICDERIEFYRNQIEKLERQKVRDALKIQVTQQLGVMPQKLELDRFLRYETTIERQLYKALDRLERLQRMRKGDFVPPPIEGNLNIQVN